MYKSGTGYTEYTASQLTQMIGRAGRPQFGNHTSAVAVILTSEGNRTRCEV